MKLTCPAPCNTTFEESFALPMSVDKFCKKLESVKCPVCGNHKTLRLGHPENPGGMK